MVCQPPCDPDQPITLALQGLRVEAATSGMSTGIIKFYMAPLIRILIEAGGKLHKLCHSVTLFNWLITGGQVLASAADGRHRLAPVRQ